MVRFAQSVNNAPRETGDFADRHGGGRLRIYGEEDMEQLMDAGLRHPFYTAERLADDVADAVPSARTSPTARGRWTTSASTGPRR